jgi:hypothetical protein
VAAGVREYTGVLLGEPRVVETFRAKSTEGAKAQMKKKHGPEYDGNAKRWVVGLSTSQMRVTEAERKAG